MTVEWISRAERKSGVRNINDPTPGRDIEEDW